MDEVLNLMQAPAAGGDDADIDELIHRRDEARAAKQFEESDRIRDELAGRGIILEDTPQGTAWKRKL